jgi:F-box-like
MSRGRTILRLESSAVQRDYQGIPPEVWLQIFPHLLSVQDIENVALTSKSFQLLAQPLLFRRISFYPRCVMNPTSGNLMIWQQDSEEINERLAFFTLERIAHGVRDVNISPETMSRMKQECTIDLSVVVDAIFGWLSRFPHLRTLDCARIVFSSKHLRGLSSLETFRAHGCEITAPLAEDNASIMTVKNLLLAMDSSYQYLLSLMHPDFLCRLTLFPLGLYQDLHRMLSDIVTHGAIYHSLRSFTSSWSALKSPCFLQALGWFYSLYFQSHVYVC